jgi:hypothetical protein
MDAMGDSMMYRTLQGESASGSEELLKVNLVGRGQKSGGI